MRGFGSSSRFRFLYRSIVVSLYRFLVLAAHRGSHDFSMLSDWLATLHRSSAWLKVAIFSNNCAIFCTLTVEFYGCDRSFKFATVFRTYSVQFGTQPRTQALLPTPGAAAKTLVLFGHVISETFFPHVGVHGGYEGN